MTLGWLLPLLCTANTAARAGMIQSRNKREVAAADMLQRLSKPGHAGLEAGRPEARLQLPQLGAPLGQPRLLPRAAGRQRGGSRGGRAARLVALGGRGGQRALQVHALGLRLAAQLLLRHVAALQPLRAQPPTALSLYVPGARLQRCFFSTLVPDCNSCAWTP